jgi:hypothetical protein
MNKKAEDNPRISTGGKVSICMFLLCHAGHCFSHGGGLIQDGFHHETATDRHDCHNSTTSSPSSESLEVPSWKPGVVIGAPLIIWVFPETCDKRGLFNVEQGENNNLNIFPVVRKNEYGISFNYKF